jgi:ABC-type multidrug transport system ATPase subunit
LVPCASDYQLSRCAGREPEGRVVFAAGVVRLILNAVMLLDEGRQLGDLYYLCMIPAAALGIVEYLFTLKIYRGLIEVYGTRWRWMWLWIIPYFNFIPALLWGWKAKYQPQWKVEELQREMTLRATHGNTAAMDTGLTVNLKERSVRDFFRKKILLWDIHMYIPQGHMVLLLAGSGAGKTTLVNSVNGYEKAKAEVLLNGNNMYTHYKSMQYETGFVPQQELIRDKDTVYYTLSDAAKLRLPKDVPIDVRKNRVEEVMDIFGLTPVKNSLVQKLSGGQKKRLSIAMELISNPSLFILDEPDSGLDGVMARELMQQLRSVADTGKIVIVITHIPDRVIEYFDDVIVLAKDSARTGRLAFYGSIREAREFFGCEKMEEIVKLLNREEEGGEGRADEFIEKYVEVKYA